MGAGGMSPPPPLISDAPQFPPTNITSIQGCSYGGWGHAPPPPPLISDAPQVPPTNMLNVNQMERKTCAPHKSTPPPRIPSYATAMSMHGMITINASTSHRYGIHAIPRKKGKKYYYLGGGERILKLRMIHNLHNYDQLKFQLSTGFLKWSAKENNAFMQAF